MLPLIGRNIVSISDLTNEEINGIFRLADRFAQDLGGGPLSVRKVRQKRGAKAPAKRPALSSICAGQILATVFMEPSTRTRLSFEAAMQRLGGRVISIPDPMTSSAVKGERLADTTRVVASYADIIVLRHPNEGAARLAAESLDDYRVAELGRVVPIINGGDGSHEHPTQTLCDLYTLRREHHKIAGLRVALCGDLLHARTVHSLAYGLARFGAQLRCISPPELRLPRYVKRRLELEFKCTCVEYDSFRDLADPQQEHVLSVAEKRGRRRAEPTLVGLGNMREGIGRLLDAVYMTRIQKERFPNPAEAEAMQGSLLIDPSVLGRIAKHTTIMHPLPRVDEVDAAVDADTRAAYFRQASYGVPIRMALMALLLGRKKLPGRAQELGPARLGACVPGARCANPTCITNNEPGARPCLVPIRQQPEVLRCAYCEQECEAEGAGG